MEEQRVVGLCVANEPLHGLDLESGHQLCSHTSAARKLTILSLVGIWRGFWASSVNMTMSSSR